MTNVEITVKLNQKFKLFGGHSALDGVILRFVVRKSATASGHVYERNAFHHFLCVMKGKCVSGTASCLDKKFHTVPHTLQRYQLSVWREGWERESQQRVFSTEVRTVVVPWGHLGWTFQCDVQKRHGCSIRGLFQNKIKSDTSSVVSYIFKHSPIQRVEETSGMKMWTGVRDWRGCSICIFKPRQSLWFSYYKINFYNFIEGKQRETNS